jgi:hypothetical protein
MIAGAGFFFGGGLGFPVPRCSAALRVQIFISRSTCLVFFAASGFFGSMVERTVSAFAHSGIVTVGRARAGKDAAPTSSEAAPPSSNRCQCAPIC